MKYICFLIKDWSVLVASVLATCCFFSWSGYRYSRISDDWDGVHSALIDRLSLHCLRINFFFFHIFAVAGNGVRIWAEQVWLMCLGFLQSSVMSDFVKRPFCLCNSNPCTCVMFWTTCALANCGRPQTLSGGGACAVTCIHLVRVMFGEILLLSYLRAFWGEVFFFFFFFFETGGSCSHVYPPPPPPICLCVHAFVWNCKVPWGPSLCLKMGATEIPCIILYYYYYTWTFAMFCPSCFWFYLSML